MLSIHVVPPCSQGTLLLLLTYILLYYYHISVYITSQYILHLCIYYVSIYITSLYILRLNIYYYYTSVYNAITLQSNKQSAFSVFHQFTKPHPVVIFL